MNIDLNTDDAVTLVNAIYGGSHTNAYRVLQKWFDNEDNRTAVDNIISIAADREAQKYEARHGHLPWADSPDCEVCRQEGARFARELP
jgi:hypothetical protein